LYDIPFILSGFSNKKRPKDRKLENGNWKMESRKWKIPPLPGGVHFPFLPVSVFEFPASTNALDRVRFWPCFSLELVFFPEMMSVLSPKKP
jgi:hypothetical protein